MFEKICFCVDRDAEDEETRELIARAVSHLKEEGLDAAERHPGEVSPAEHPECLYLSDSQEEALKLQDKGAKVVGFLHAGNRGEKFQGLKFVFDEIDEVEADSFKKAWERLSGLPWTILRTKRLTVRETTVDDVDEFYRIYRDPAMTEFQEGLFEDPEDERRYTRDYIKNVYGLLGFGVWTLLRREDGRIIGRAGFSVRQGFEEIELGFMIATPFQGQGYAYEACEAIMRYGKQVLMLPRVQTLVKEGNDASVRLCEKLGFERAGETMIEEDIYGKSYRTDGTVSFSPSRYGRYIRFVKEFG